MYFFSLTELLCVSFHPAPDFLVVFFSLCPFSSLPSFSSFLPLPYFYWADGWGKCSVEYLMCVCEALMVAL